MPKFFITPEQIHDNAVVISGNDAKHISFSLRMKTGDIITVCDSNKHDYECSISSFEDGLVRATIESHHICEAEPHYFIRLFQCLPKGDKMEYIIQKAVELGVSSIVPVYSSRCIAKPTANKDKKAERYNRIAYEAAGQCGRGIIPIISDCIDFKKALEIAKDDGMKFICYEGNRSVSLKEYFEENCHTQKSNNVISFFIGAEGGFSQEEISLAEQYGIHSVGLGKRILRTETASGFVLSSIAYQTEL